MRAHDRPPPRLWPDCVPTLVDTATGVTLRAHTDADIPALIEQCIDSESVRWTTVPQPYGVAEAHAYIHDMVASCWRTDTQSAWAIEAEIDGVRRFCGQVDVRHPDDLRGEIGFALHPAARGRGIMTVAARLAIDWAFDVRRLQVMRWAALVGNWPSRHTAAALGFRDEGVRRRDRLHRGELRDHWSASLLPDDPRVSVAAPRQPLLAGNRVRLRPFVDADAPRIVEACSDADSARWLPLLPSPYGPSDAQAFVDACREGAYAGTQWTWAVTDSSAPDPDRCVGAVTLSRLRAPSRQGEIGYWLHPDARGRGLMTEASGAVAAYALGHGPHDSLVLRCAAANVASRAVAARTGFTETGVVPRAQRLRDGAYADLVGHVRLR
ncbi:GNAT family N-acetyltransferase [Mariniluteicoccus flavus]